MLRALRHIVFYALLLNVLHLAAQGNSANDCMAAAQKLVLEEKIEAASGVLGNCYEMYPDRVDLANYYARTLAWRNKYEEARKVLAEVYSIDSENLEAILLDSDIDYWSTELNKSSKTLDRGLGFAPENEELLIRKAKVSHAMSERKTAWEYLETLLNINPDHVEGKQLREILRTNKRPKVLGVTLISDRFSEYYDNRFTLNAFLKVPRKKVTYIGSANLTEVNGRQGLQLEGTMYPTFGKYGYAYLNAAWSRSAIYPRYKIGVEWFKDFKKVSFSLGFRHNIITRQIKNTIYLASVSQFIRNLTLAYRLFALPVNGDWIFSHVIDGRLLTRNKHLLHGFIGIGSYTELQPILFQNDLTYWDPRTFQSFGMDYTRNFDEVAVKAGFIYTRQQFHQFPYPFLRKLTYVIGIEARF